MRQNATRILLVLTLVLLPAIGNRVAFCADQELIVSAAASLTNAFGDLGKKFEAASPGTRIVFNFGASGVLLQQIDKGAPVDVFASADQKTMDQAMEKNLIVSGTRKDFVRNELVLVVPKDSKAAIQDLAGLKAKEFGKIAIGNPESVPVGRYAKEALIREKLWDDIEAKCILGESVRQVLDYVSRGEVDAGFVFSTDASIAKEKVNVVTEVTQHAPITYPIAVVAGTKNQAAAERFVQFVLSKEGREILAHYGFKTP
jgi:molybdate transport system substrate-binding protein